MEFKSLKNIVTSFQYIRNLTIIIICLSFLTCGIIVIWALQFAQKEREKIYVLDEGKSLMLALSQDASLNRPAEARQHIEHFHKLFFTLAPDRSAIENNIRRALLISDRSAYNYFKDLSEKGYYNRIVSSNINQILHIDSILCDFNQYPYLVSTYAKQRIIRESNITERSLITRCRLMNSVRSDDNPQGFIIENFEVLENKDLRSVNR